MTIGYNFIERDKYMEYVGKNGKKVIVEGNQVQYGDGTVRKSIIGANFIHGMICGGYLSSFNGTFNEELIGIGNGIGDIFNATIGDVKEAYEILKMKIRNADSSSLYELSRAVLETVDEFFGGIKHVDTRLDYYYPDDFQESKDNQIAHLKGKGAAMCVERSALAQNLLKSLGINSYFKSSGILIDGVKDAHSYNLIEYDGKYYIFDTSVPNLINNQVNPLIAELDEKTFDLLSAPISDLGISVTVSHYNPYRGADVSITYDASREKQIVVNPLGEEGQKHL